MQIKKKKWRNFDEAKKYAHSLKLKDTIQWRKLGRSNLPNDIPIDPSAVYKKQFRGWGDFLGTGNVRGHLGSKLKK